MAGSVTTTTTNTTHILLLIWVSAALSLASSATTSAPSVYYSRLIHHLSPELDTVFSANRSGGMRHRLTEGAAEYYRLLLDRDRHRQTMKIGPRHQLIFPSEGSRTTNSGNDLGWLHYAWIDVGTPKVSFLVAVDDGSDLFWLPCNCIQCASLSSGKYSGLDRDLSEYDPSKSSTSRNVPCGHKMCLAENCQSATGSCPYTAEYNSGTTSGMLVEDVLHLSSSSASSSNASLRVPVVLGCGEKQTGGYLDVAAPDGVMGLGLDEISVPSILAKAGLIRNSFSLCFNRESSGTILFGDQGISTQKTTPFLNGELRTYVVGINSCCIGKSSCLKQTSFTAIVDSGTSFTYFPPDTYKKVVQEFDRQFNATRTKFDTWEYCYEGSEKERPNFPSVKLTLSSNNSFVIHNPVLGIYASEELYLYCLTLSPAKDDSAAIIGQDFMTGYRLVFDRENMKLGWSRSDCQDLSNDETGAPASSPSNIVKSPNPLPSDQQQSPPKGHAVAPAVAGRAPSKPSATSTSTAAAAHHGGLFWLVLTISIFVSVLFSHQQWLFEPHTGPA